MGQRKGTQTPAFELQNTEHNPTLGSKDVSVVTEFGDVSVQNPLPTDGDSVYEKDIWVEESDSTDWTGTITDIVNNLHTTLINSTTDNPKTLLIHFKRTIYANAVGFGANSGSFKNLEIQFIGSGNQVRYTHDLIKNDSTARTSYLAEVPKLAFNAIRLNFYTADTISLSNFTIRKSITTDSILISRKPDQTFTDIQATQGGNLKTSLEEFESEIFQSLPLPVKEYHVTHAENVILENYGDTARVDTKNKDLTKFGINENVQTTYSTIMTLPSGEQNETYVTGNDITHFASDNAADNQQIVVEGHTLSGSDLTFSTQTVTLNGQTKTALTTPLYRVTRAYNNNSTEIQGNVYIAEDVIFTGGVPQTATAVHLIIPAGRQQSEKASTSLSSTDYWLITSFSASILEKGSVNYAEVELQVRRFGKVFRPVAAPISVGSGDTTEFTFHPYLIVPKNSDVRLVAKASANGTGVSGSIQGYLANIQ